MKTHIVGIFSHHDAVNKIHVVLAENEVDAAKKALLENCEEKYRNEDYKEWVDGLGDTLEKVSEGALQSELVLSNMISIQS